MAGMKGKADSAAKPICTDINARSGMSSQPGTPALAARWTDGRLYPYTGEYDPAKANTHDTGIGQTSAVGNFPNGTAFEGLHDLSGNVFEWCLNGYSKPENIQIGGNKSRVLRGGSWGYNQSSACAVSRFHGIPYERNDDNGFRLACSSPI